MSNLDSLEKLKFVRTLLNSSISNLNKMNKAVEVEGSFNIHGSPKRTAQNRGGRATSVTANAMTATSMYNQSIESLKKATEKL